MACRHGFLSSILVHQSVSHADPSLRCVCVPSLAHDSIHSRPQKKKEEFINRSKCTGDVLLLNITSSSCLSVPPICSLFCCGCYLCSVAGHFQFNRLNFEFSSLSVCPHFIPYYTHDSNSEFFHFSLCYCFTSFCRCLAIAIVMNKAVS